MASVLLIPMRRPPTTKLCSRVYGNHFKVRIIDEAPLEGQFRQDPICQNLCLFGRSHGRPSLYERSLRCRTRSKHRSEGIGQKP
jgi:hypothetical protein